jgi:tetratricopeptide (TPR) repeat protein
MTADPEKTTDPGAKRPIVLSPWLVALAAMVLYGVMLNGSVTFGSLPLASQIMGWDWHPRPLLWRPNPQFPLFFILTYPLRWLPAGWRVMGLNALTAACAALTLAILAHSVRLLAHDRTSEQRRRLRGDDALLPVRAAYLPAAFAVLLLGAQSTFWENAVAGTGEAINLLVFAFLILCLLEYRVSKGDWLPGLFAFVYGVGLSNSWALIGFFPCFLLALMWIKGRGFFDWRFVLRVVGCGALGLLLYGLIPLQCALAHDGGFWHTLHLKLSEQRAFLTRIPRYFAVVAALPTLIPLLVAAIKWPSSDGNSKPGLLGFTLLLPIVNLAFLAVGILMFFDVSFSPNPRNMGIGITVGTSGFLSFYYLGALSVGYFSGYVLLVFGTEVGNGLRRATNMAVVGLLWLAAIGLPAALLCGNFPRVRASNSPVVAQFAMEMARSMPAKASVVLDDDPARLYLAMEASQILALPDQYMFIESRSLVHREYLRYLANRYPVFGERLGDQNHLPEQITDQEEGNLLAHLARQEPVYFLHPSFGGHLERLCMTPDRVGVYLHPYPTNVGDTLGLSAAAIAGNQVYWHRLENEALALLPELARSNVDARRVAAYYSQTVNFWGTELQKTGTRRKLPALLNDANEQFAVAIRLNPNNVAARVNRQYNARLRGAAPEGQLIASSDIATQFQNHWDIALNQFGPLDVPDLDAQIGLYYAQRTDFQQAASWFQRSLQLVPNDPPRELDLINAYIDLGFVDAAFVLISDMHKRSAGNPLELAGLEALAYIARNDFDQADKLLAAAHAMNPKDAKFAGTMAALYRLIGNKLLREGKANPASAEHLQKDAAIWFDKAESLANRAAKSPPQTDPP